MRRKPLRSLKTAIPWILTGLVGLASVFAFIGALPGFGTSVRATAITVGFWAPPVTALLGALILNRRPGNRIGWLLLGIGLAMVLEFHLQIFLDTAPVGQSAGHLAAVVLAYTAAMPLALYLLFMIPYLFPSGTFLSRNQSWVGWPFASLLIAQLFVVMFTEEIGPAYPSEQQTWTLENPIGFLPATVVNITTAVMILVLVMMAVGGAVSLMVRYRQSDPVTRAQIRWMLFSTVILAVVLIAIAVTQIYQTYAGGFLLSIAFAGIPLSITVAINRYKLFEIDRIISRSVSYTGVVVVLGVVFAVGVIWIPTRLELEESPLLIAGTTLAAAALFNPLRRKLQAIVDRRFNRAQFQVQAVVEQFAAEMQTTHSVDELLDIWLRTVDDSLRPATIGVWLNETG